MPDIEVTLDEIKDTTIKTQKDLDNLMRDWSKPDYKAAAKSAAAGFPASGAGFLDTVIKGITSKSVIGGLITGGAAGGVLVLAEAIKALTKQSKILTTVQDTVGKALGLLVDLVLLPFLPLLIFGLFYLYTAVIGLGKIWNDYIKNPAAAVVTGPAAAAQTVVGPIGFDIGRWIGENFTDKIIQSLIVNYQKWKDAAGKTWDQWVDAFNKTWKIWADAFWKTIDEWKLNFSKWWDGATKIISESWKKVTDGFDANFITPIKNALNVLRNAFINMINFVIDKINTILPPGWKINTIAKEQDYTDPGTMKKPFSSANVQVTNNFNGFTSAELPDMVGNAIRQVGDRYMPTGG